MSTGYTPQAVSDVQQTIDKLHNYCRDFEDDYSPLKAVNEISKLLFVKLVDEQRVENGNQREFTVQDLSASERSPAEWINELFERETNRATLGFDEERIELSDETVTKSVRALENLHLADADVDVKGVAYERVLEDIFRGDLGQFFTPREVVKFMVGIADPTFNPDEGDVDSVIDPAVGSGGFLIEVLNHYAQQTNHEKVPYDVASENVWGIDKASWLLRLCNTNLNLHTSGGWKGFENVYQGNSLKTNGDSISVNGVQGQDAKVPLREFDILIANPPFGSQESRETARQFYTNSEEIHREVEALFLKRSFDFVRPGGDIVILLPKTLIKGPKFRGLQEWIREHAIINSVVHLPLVTFRPFESEIKTVVMHMTKKDEESEQRSIYFDAATYVGHDGKGNKISRNDLPTILENYNEHRGGEQ